MTPQELKNSILQLAIQDKLVEQRAEEGTGAELLEKILAAKNAEGAKGKGEKSHAKSAKSAKVGSCVSREEIPDDEKPFDIPESWEWVRLGEIGSWASGATPSRTHSEYYGGSIPWLKTGDLTDGYVSSIPEFITDLALEKNSVRLNPVGSVLMAMYGATIGKLGILQIAATTNQACCACIPYDGVWNKYLFYYLMARRKAFIKMGEGGAQPNISKEKIVNALIPLPPLAEQKRIVAKIEELLPLIDRYEKAWSRLKDFNKRFPIDMQKSLLQMAIQGKLVEQRPEEGTGEELYRRLKSYHSGLKPCKDELDYSSMNFTIPANWTMIELNQLFDFVDYRGKTPNKTTSGVFLITASNIRQAYMDYTRKEYISREEYKGRQSRGLTQKGDLLFTTEAPMGNAALCDLDECSCGQRIITFKEYAKGTAYPALYMYFLLSPQFQQQLLDNCTGTTAKGIKADKLKHFLIPLPPLAEQKRIVAKLEELLPLCERLKSASNSAVNP